MNELMNSKSFYTINIIKHKLRIFKSKITSAWIRALKSDRRAPVLLKNCERSTDRRPDPPTNLRGFIARKLYFKKGRYQFGWRWQKKDIPFYSYCQLCI